MVCLGKKLPGFLDNGSRRRVTFLLCEALSLALRRFLRRSLCGAMSVQRGASLQNERPEPRIAGHECRSLSQ
jgi:hypothetical protein